MDQDQTNHESLPIRARPHNKRTTQTPLDQITSHNNTYYHDGVHRNPNTIPDTRLIEERQTSGIQMESSPRTVRASHPLIIRAAQVIIIIIITLEPLNFHQGLCDDIYGTGSITAFLSFIRFD